MANPGIQSDWVERVADALTHLHSEFEKNELAYLALTSKIERQIVDRLAFSLSPSTSQVWRCGQCRDRTGVREFTVSKEIQRVDLAVTVNEQPVLFLESKAMNYFHMYFRSAGTKYPGKVKADIHKMQAYVQNASLPKLTKITLLLTTYVDGTLNPDLGRIVKYSGDMQRHPGKGLTDLLDRLDTHFPNSCFQRVDSGTGDIAGGRAFDMDVTVHFRLFGPH